MTTAQWLFHYLEICHHQKRDFKWEIEKLRAGSSDIKRALKYLMIVTEPNRGKQAVEAIEDEDEARYNNENENRGGDAFSSCLASSPRFSFSLL